VDRDARKTYFAGKWRRERELEEKEYRTEAGDELLKGVEKPGGKRRDLTSRRTKPKKYQ